MATTARRRRSRGAVHAAAGPPSALVAGRRLRAADRLVPQHQPARPARLPPGRGPAAEPAGGRRALRGLRARRRIAQPIYAGVPCTVAVRVAPPRGRVPAGGAHRGRGAGPPAELVRRAARARGRVVPRPGGAAAARPLRLGAGDGVERLPVRPGVSPQDAGAGRGGDRAAAAGAAAPRPVPPAAVEQRRPTRSAAADRAATPRPRISSTACGRSGPATTRGPSTGAPPPAAANGWCGSSRTFRGRICCWFSTPCWRATESGSDFRGSGWTTSRRRSAWRRRSRWSGAATAAAG